MEDNSFSSLVAKLNEMSETGAPAKKHKEIKVIKKAKREGTDHKDPNVNAMAELLESIDESKPNHLKGKHKLKTVPAGEHDGTTKNPSKGKLVGEENIDEDLIADLSSRFRDLLEPKKVAEEEPTDEAVGEFAEPLYTLQDELGLEDNVLVDELTRWMSGDDIKDFVAHFRQNHDMPEAGQDEPEEGIVGAIGQGIDNLAVGAGKLAWKGAKKAAPHIKQGVKKGAKKLSKIGSKHTSYDVKTGKATTTTGMANA